MKFLSYSVVFLLGIPLVNAQVTTPSIGGCPMFPANSVWNTRVDNLPILGNSAAYVADLGASSPVHPDFGSDPESSFPVNIVHGNSVPPADVSVLWSFTSDPGPYPIPSDAVIGPGTDYHMIVLDVDNCMLYESFVTTHNPDGSWSVYAISKFNLKSNALKPPYWSSSNAAGTPQLPLLIRYDEIVAGHIDHAISITASPTGNYWVWPASHSASTNPSAPPMGTRFRLKANYDVSHFSPTNQIILNAMKVYGVIITDNGASWHLQGEPDPRWSDADLHNLTSVPGSAFEAVDESSLMIDSSSGQVQPPPQATTTETTGTVPAGWVELVNGQTGFCATMSNSVQQSLIAMSRCTGAASQKFQFLPVEGGWYTNGTTWLFGNGWLQHPGAAYIVESALTGQVVASYVQAQTGVPDVNAPFIPFANYVWEPVQLGSNYYVQNDLNGNVLAQSQSFLGQMPLSVSNKAIWWKLVPVQ